MIDQKNKIPPPTVEIVVEDYNPEWAVEFQRLKRVFETKLKRLYVDIHHVGSTAVVGLAAKPIIDLDIVIKEIAYLCPLATILNELGYKHIGDLGIIGREAFSRESDLTPEDGSGYKWHNHHLYVCIEGAIGLRNHLALRDYLRKHPGKAAEYGALKKKLAKEFPSNIDAYIEHKTPFITSILNEIGFHDSEIKDITRQNKA